MSHHSSLAILLNSTFTYQATDIKSGSATPIHRGGPLKGKGPNSSGRDGVPPPGYLCYRCGEKGKHMLKYLPILHCTYDSHVGHWIQSCPTNDDPTFDGKPRVKRTTGIPRSFLTKIERPTTLANDGTVDDTKPPPGAMVNAEGEWVVAEPDKASWEQFHAKAKISAAAQEVAARGSKELQDRGLECSIDKRLFVEPTKTPCCQTTYCLECITDALLENDLRCPACSTDNILIDDLKPDDEKAAEIRKYEDEKNAASIQQEKSRSPKAEEQPSSQKSSPPSKPRTSSPVGETSKKRPAESELKNDRLPHGKSSTDTKQSNTNGKNAQWHNQSTKAPSKMPTNNQFPFPAANFMLPQGIEPMAFSLANGFTGMPMTMAPMMGMGSAMFDPMAMQNATMMGGSNGNWNTMWAAGFPQQNMNPSGARIVNGMMPNNSYGQQNMHVAMNYGFVPNGMRPNGQGMGSFTNQQRNVFSASTHNEEDSAYFRKPVNPHRHQARRNVNRPTDYREI